jgi:hypothetical protein
MSTLILRSKLTSAKAVLLLPKSLISFFHLRPELLPTVLFISLTYGAVHFLFGHLRKSGCAALLNAQCPPNPGPYNMRYTGVGPIDDFLCILVVFFRTNLGSTTRPFSVDFLASFATPVALSFIEAARTGRSIVLAFPVALGLFYQTKGAGVAFPLFWLALILSGHDRLDRVTARIDQAKAEAALFAVLAGFALPSSLMFFSQNIMVTAHWQFFPLCMWLVQAAHLFIRPSSRHHTSGYWTVQSTYIFTFITSAIFHIVALWGAWGDLALLRHLYVPRILPPDPATTNLHLATHVFFQWDAAFSMGSCLLGTLWFAGNAKQVPLIALWNVIASIVVGPGAAVSGVLLWRERSLNGTPEGVAKKE